MRVLIVGAGIIGLSIAEELTRRGVEVELFEKSAEPGSEASSAAAGILSPQGEAKSPGPFLDLLLKGYQMIPEAVARLQTLTGIDLKYRASGMMGLAFSSSDEEELKAELSWQQEAGLWVERLEASQVRKLEPAVDGAVRWGILWPQTSHLDNTALVGAYVKAVAVQGGTLHLGAPVFRFLMEKDRLLGLETDSGKVYGDWVVNAAGCWAGFDPELPFSIPAVPVRGQMLRFRTERPRIQRILRSPRAYLVQRSGDQLIAGTTVEHAGYEKRVTPEGRESIRRGVAEMIPDLSRLEEEASWAGLRPDSPDHLPILGETPLKGLLLATGLFRNGILLAPLTGKLLADWMTAGEAPPDLAPFQVERFLVSYRR
ncbi:MAG: glycine oxidase ThiO [Candidatus Omnitrophica bacterium]|nr:glycine oxidase ThiO [Candidatus Omnitrophota bacterium]